MFSHSSPSKAEAAPCPSLTPLDAPEFMPQRLACAPRTTRTAPAPLLEQLLPTAPVRRRQRRSMRRAAPRPPRPTIGSSPGARRLAPSPPGGRRGGVPSPAAPRPAGHARHACARMRTHPPPHSRRPDPAPHTPPPRCIPPRRASRPVTAPSPLQRRGHDTHAPRLSQRRQIAPHPSPRPFTAGSGAPATERSVALCAAV